VIQPWDVTSLKAIEKAILSSDVGITPTNDGKVLRLVFPQLTEDRRKELCKEIKKLGEECKVAVRNVRRDSIEKLKAKKKASELTEDEVKDGEKQIQDVTDKYVAEIDKMVSEKDKEIMSI
jgi:ribosome recycling factor